MIYIVYETKEAYIFQYTPSIHVKPLSYGNNSVGPTTVQMHSKLRQGNIN